MRLNMGGADIMQLCERLIPYFYLLYFLVLFAERLQSVLQLQKLKLRLLLRQKENSWLQKKLPERQKKLQWQKKHLKEISRRLHF